MYLGPADKIIIKEIRKHIALCGSEFPDCGIAHALREIFAKDAAWQRYQDTFITPTGKGDGR